MKNWISYTIKTKGTTLNGFAYVVDATLRDQGDIIDVIINLEPWVHGAEYYSIDFLHDATPTKETIKAQIKLINNAMKQLREGLAVLKAQV